MSPNNNRPALEPPPGQQSDFDSPPESLQTTIIVTLAVCLLVSTVSVAMRAYAQLRLFKGFVWADAWLVLGWASHVAFAAMLLACLPYGAGRHQWDVRLSNYYTIEFFLYISFVLYDVAIAGAKVSILLQLSAVFSGRNRGLFYWTSLFLILINVIFYVALSFALVFQCRPLEKAWNHKVDGICVNQDALLTSSGPFNIISDFLIFLLPIWAIWQLRLPVRRRLEVISAFAVGFFGCICSAVRLVYSNRLKGSGDATWVIFQNQLWANAEITAGVLIASIFVLPRLIRQWRGRDRSYPHSSYEKYASQNTHNKSANASQNNAWASRQSGGHNRRFPRQPYIELEEINSCVEPSATISDMEPAIPRGTASQFDNWSSHFDSTEVNPEAGDAGIVKTVEIELTEERVPVHAPAPVAIPGSAWSLLLLRTKKR